MKTFLLLTSILLISSCAHHSVFETLKTPVQKSYHQRILLDYADYPSIDKERVNDYLFVIRKGNTLPIQASVNTEIVETDEIVNLKLKKDLFIAPPQEWCDYVDADAFFANIERCIPYTSFDQKNWLPLMHINQLFGITTNGFSSSFKKNNGLFIRATFTAKPEKVTTSQ